MSHKISGFVFFVLMLAWACLSLGQPAPYPILLIHGINSSHTMWEEEGGLIRQFENYGWRNGGAIHVTLDYNRNSVNPSDTKERDVHLFTATVPPADFYAINFDVDATFSRLAVEDDNVSALLFGMNAFQTEIFPSNLDRFRKDDLIRIEEEYMKVENVGSDRLTVLRGLYNSALRAHADGAVIYIVSNQSNQAGIAKQAWGLGLAIAAIRTATQAQRVILVGHSMGGLAARYYAQNFAANQVAKIVTLGTPHLGAIKADLYFDEAIAFVYDALDQKSEAARDLAYWYEAERARDLTVPGVPTGLDNGVFLFGGNENGIPAGLFLNRDVNANGNEGDFITGLNRGPLPNHFEYYFLSGLARDETVAPENTLEAAAVDAPNDGAVLVSRQWLNLDDRFYGGNYAWEVTGPPVHAWHTKAFTLLPVGPDTWESHEIAEVFKALDEPDGYAQAYELRAGNSHQIFSTPQSHGGIRDRDWFFFNLAAARELEIVLRDFPLSNNAGAGRMWLYAENNLTTALDSAKSLAGYDRLPLRKNFNPGRYYLRVETISTEISWQTPMSLSLSSLGVPAQLAWEAGAVALPANNIATATLAVKIFDVSGNHLTSAANSVRFDLTSGAASARLLGTNPVNAVNGVATITLQATTTPGLVTIQATSPGLASATTTVSIYSNPTPVSGPITANTIWTLSKSPYQVTGDIDVRAGVTLTIEAGVSVLFNGGTDISVSGALLANGTASQHIAFTSSSANPIVGAWGGMRLNPSQNNLRSSFNYCDFSYGGQGGFDADDVFEMFGQAEPQISNCTITNSRRNGIELLGGDYSSSFRLSGTSLPIFLLRDLTIQSGAVLAINPGVLLKFGRGVDLFVDGALSVQGTASERVIFTSLRDDAVGGDTGGDGATTGSTGDWSGIFFRGSAEGARCQMIYCDLRFAGGGGGFGNLDTPVLLDARVNPTFSALRFTSCRYNGIDLHGGEYSNNIILNQTAAPYILRGDLTVLNPAVLTIMPGTLFKMGTGIDFRINGGLVATGSAGNAIRFTSLNDDSRGGDTNNDGQTVGNPGDWSGLHFEAGARGSSMSFCEFHFAGGGSGFNDVKVPVLLDLRAEVNFANLVFNRCTRNGIVLHATTYERDTRLRFPGNTPFIQLHDLNIAAGARLTIDPGCVIKMDENADLEINGGLLAEGTATAPIVFTSLADDSLLGDTNNDGPSLAQPNDWGGIEFRNTATSTSCRMHHVHLRFGGRGGNDNVGWVVQVSPLVNPVFANLRFVKNSANGIRLEPGSFTARITFDQTAAPYLLSGDYFIEASGGLTIAPGTLFKCYGGSDFFIRSRLTALGTANAPIIFTSFRDDRFGGDTNNDGASNGVPGDWGGIIFEASSVAGGSEIGYNELWFGASAGAGNSDAALYFRNTSQKVHHTKIRRTRWQGVRIQENGAPDLGGGAYASAGQNSFLDFNDQQPDRYAVYNDGPNTIFARNNLWDGATAATIGQEIYDKTDNATKGEVIFQPFILPGDREAPQVSVIFPNGGETLLLGANATLRWFARDNVGVTQIEVALARDGGQIFSPLAAFNTVQEEYVWKVSGPPSSRCVLKITGRDAAGNARFDISDNFFALADSGSGVNFPPSLPLPLRPLSGEEMRNNDLLLWQASVDPNPFDQILYRLEIDNNADFSSPELVEDNIDGSRTSLIPENLKSLAALAGRAVIAVRLDGLAGFANLQDDVVYHWRVRARDRQNAASSFSDGAARFFMNKTNTAPQAVNSGFSPANNLEVRAARPTISWQAANDPDPSDAADVLQYRVQMDDDGEFSANVEIDGQTSAGVTFFIPPQDLHENMNYSYRVQARDDESAVSPWSTVQIFWVNAMREPPRAFAAVAPANDFISSSDTVTFLWQASSDPDPFDSLRYVLEWSTEAQFSTLHRLSVSAPATQINFVRPDSMPEIFWRLKAVDPDSLETFASNTDRQPRRLKWPRTEVAEKKEIPKQYALRQNYPNPFNPATRITFSVPAPGEVLVRIYNALGQHVRTLVERNLPAGNHEVIWDGRDAANRVAPAGIYFCHMQARGFTARHKLVVVR